MPDRERVRVVYGGTVQGVGFRYTVLRLAKPRPLVGFVKNLSDGTVELVPEGDRAELAGLLDSIASAMEGYIRDSAVSWSPATGEFRSFGIGH